MVRGTWLCLNVKIICFSINLGIDANSAKANDTRDFFKFEVKRNILAMAVKYYHGCADVMDCPLFLLAGFPNFLEIFGKFLGYFFWFYKDGDFIIASQGIIDPVGTSQNSDKAIDY